MSYSKSNSTLTLYNSTSDCNSALIQAIEKNMTAFLSSFDMPAPVSGVASPRILGGGKMSDFRRITPFVWKNASQSTK